VTVNPKAPAKRELSNLRNVGKAALADFRLVGVASVEDLAGREADSLYRDLCQVTGQRHDPCVHDVFAATVHEARTGEAIDWWAFTPTRKARQRDGTFPAFAPPRI
jgi:hypothetical protein